jgi:hypothetical protein
MTLSRLHVVLGVVTFLLLFQSITSWCQKEVWALQFQRALRRQLQ